MEMLLYIFEAGQSGRIFFDSITIFFQKLLTGLLGYSYMFQSLRVVGRNNTDPSNIIELDICDHIFVFFIFTDSQYSTDSTSENASKGAPSAALFESAILAGIDGSSIVAWRLFLFFALKLRWKF